MDFEFRPRIFPTIVAVGLVIILLSLGTWQMFRFIEKANAEDVWAERRRAESKPLRSLEAFEGADDYRQVDATGTLDETRVAYYANQRFRGEPGCLVASPLKLVDGGTLLALRGFVPHTREQRCDQAELTAPSSDSWHGLLHTVRPNLADVPSRSQTGDRTRWQLFDVEGTYLQMGIADGPSTPTVLVLHERHVGDPFPLPSYEHVSDPYLTSMRHLNYAGTWFICVLLVIGAWGAISMKRVPSENDALS